MNNVFPVVPNSAFSEREGIHYVGLIASQIGAILRETSNTDLGIDGYLEVVVNGAPIGLIAVQVKSGKSYMKSQTDSSFIFRADQKHVRYWLSYRLPVIVVIYDPEEKIGYWHFVQDYFSENDNVPEGKSVPIKISKANRFHESLEKLTRIASTPDSTALAMLALKASRYHATKELLSAIEMVELYGKRKWLGEWLPLDYDREELLLHSSLGKKGPAWYWFQTRPGKNQDFIPYLKSALKHPDHLVRREALLAIASSNINDLGVFIRGLINEENFVFDTEIAYALIDHITDEDRTLIVDEIWRQMEKNQDWTRNSHLELLSVIALLGGSNEREKVINEYISIEGYIAKTIVPSLLKTAGFLWNINELHEVRKIAQSADHFRKALAMTALAQIGEAEDIPLLIKYISQGGWVTPEDRLFIAKELSNLFSENDIDQLISLLGSGYDYEFIARPALSRLCGRLKTQTLLDWLNGPNNELRKFGIEGITAAGEFDLLKPYEHLLDSDDLMLQELLSIGLVATGDWAIIDRIAVRDDFFGSVGKGLRYVNSQKAQDMLLKIIINKETETMAKLSAAESLAIIGDENMLQEIINHLTKSPNRDGAEILLDVGIQIDRRLYCPVHWPEKIERDFTPRRYSVRRYED